MRDTSLRLRSGLVVGALAALVVGIGLAQGACARLHTPPGWRSELARRAGPEALPAVALGRGVGQALRWQRRATLPPELREASDLASTPSGLVIAASRDALTSDGAGVFRLDRAGRLRSLLRWSGQGFLRVHAWGDRLVIPDADAPFHALAFALDLDVDGYVFVSDARGALETDQRALLPAVYHVFDVALLASGRLVGSTGAYPPEAVAYLSSRAPAALFLEDGEGRPWRRVLEYPSHDAEGVSRFTWLHALPEGSLLAAVQSSVPSLPTAVRIDLVGGTPSVTAVTGLQGQVLRWASWRGGVYAVSQEASGTTLRVSRDGGASFVPLVTTAPQSLAVSSEALFLLDDGALLASTDGARFEVLAPSLPALRHRASTLVSAPLAVHEGSVWSASPSTGEVFEALPAGP